jgi:thiamine monophosphate kinase
MPIPVVQSDCPPGLEYLTQIDQLLIKQQVELLEGKLSLLNRHVVTVEKIWSVACEAGGEYECVFVLPDRFLLKLTQETTGFQKNL